MVSLNLQELQIDLDGIIGAGDSTVIITGSSEGYANGAVSVLVIDIDPPTGGGP